jgi:hypothetical protein
MNSRNNAAITRINCTGTENTLRPKKIKLNKQKLEKIILNSGFTTVKHFIEHFRKQGGFGMTSYYEYLKNGFKPIDAWGLCYYLDIELKDIEIKKAKLFLY